MVKKVNLLSFVFFICITSILSTFVAFRDITTVEDNLYYISNFRNTITFADFNYEFLFELFTLIIRKLTDNYIVYFFSANLLLNSILYYTAFLIAKFYKIKYEFYLPIFIFLLLLSTWYYTEATNGLRQGLSLALMYLSLVQLVLYKKIKSFLILALMSCFFHYSSVLILPVVILYKLKLNNLFYLSCLVAVFYILGINENIIKFLSNITNIPLYTSITAYSGTAIYRYGFQADLFIYTFGLSLLFYIATKYFLYSTYATERLVKLYILLTLPYYIFGFGNFSNRYGVISWFFTIFINSYFLYILFHKNKNIFYVVFISLFFISLVTFLSRYVFTI